MRTKSLLVALVLGAITALLPATAASAGPPGAPEPSTGERPHPTTAADVQMAGSPTFNYRELWLRFPSVPEKGKDVCKSRDIKLASGWYYWRHEDRPENRYYSKRTIYLAAGWYHWKDCIGGFERASDDHHPYYHDTYLRRSSTGAYVYLDRGWIFRPKSSDPIVYVHGQFGSSLRLL